MKRLLKSTQFKKDIKRYANDSIKMQALLEVMRLLENETPLPECYRPHPLRGKYKGCMECHVNGDFLLIWIDGGRYHAVSVGLSFRIVWIVFSLLIVPAIIK